MKNNNVHWQFCVIFRFLDGTWMRHHVRCTRGERDRCGVACSGVLVIYSGVVRAECEGFSPHSLLL